VIIDNYVNQESEVTMNKTEIPKRFEEQRYFNPADGTIYYQVCRNTLMKLAKSANAYRKVGRRVLIDRVVLDKYLEDHSTTEKTFTQDEVDSIVRDRLAREREKSSKIRG